MLLAGAGLGDRLAYCLWGAGAGAHVQRGPMHHGQWSHGNSTCGQTHTIPVETLPPRNFVNLHTQLMSMTDATVQTL